MKNRWILATGLAIVLTLLFISGCTSRSTTVGDIISGQQEGIWVSGKGEVTAVPDITTLSLGVEAQAASVAEAQSQAAQAMNRVMDALTGKGVKDKDIQTQYFSIYQVTRWDSEKEKEIVTGYRVTNTVTAKIRDTEKTGVIIDAVATAGGDLTRINSISFSIDDPSPYYEEAREKAMADAKAKAGQLAKLAGVTLGKPTYISESTQSPSIIYPRAYAEAGGKAADATPISPGEMDIILNVQVTYAILD